MGSSAYHQAVVRLESVLPEEDGPVLREVLAGADFADREAAVTRYVDRVAEGMPTVAALRDWALAREEILAATVFPRRRLDQWLECRRILEQRHPGDAAEADEWVQERVSDLSDDWRVLARLVDGGRTRRIRARAAERLEEVQRQRVSSGAEAGELRELVASGASVTVRRRAEQRLRALGLPV